MAGENPARLTWVRTLRCLCRGHVDTCGGSAVEAHHAGRRGMGRRAHDDTAVPLCAFHHREWHDASGVFKGWNQAERRAWAEAAVAAIDAAWVQHKRQALSLDWLF